MSLNRRDLLRYGIYGIAATALPAPAEPAGGLGAVVSCVIHPAIGIARVGNSPTGYFLGPEIPGPPIPPPGGYKDSEGRLLRQAVRFRVFGLDASGSVVAELTSENAEITWQVHLANKKAAWFDFVQPFDIPESIKGVPSHGIDPLVVGLRNKDVTGKDRTQLVIDPGARCIAGRSVNSQGGNPLYAFDTGFYFDVNVPIGELRTDDAGRLLVFGGTGFSGSPIPDNAATTFANNVLWFDDTSDGPVEATVRIGGRTFQATGAWAVVAPPDYAPGVHSTVTMYDVIFRASAAQARKANARPSFTRQIYPLLQRQVFQQWVNQGVLLHNGWGTPGDFTTPENLAMLSSPLHRFRPARTAVFREFRNPDFRQLEADRLPPYYGDAVAFPPTSPRYYYAVLPTQYHWLRQWAAGDFIADWPAGGLRFPADLKEIPLQEQPSALDRAALDEALGGPFHPGCEMTWPMRAPVMYDAPFRIRRRQGPEPNWGPTLNWAVALASNGPLSASGPGDLTRWMAVPWQTDTSSCLFAYNPEEGAFLPTFWPARVPNQVLRVEDYETILDPASSPAERLAAFESRQLWFSSRPRTQPEAIKFINEFVHDWYQAGVITLRPGPGDGSFPEQFWVQEGRNFPPTEPGDEA